MVSFSSGGKGLVDKRERRTEPCWRKSPSDPCPVSWLGLPFPHPLYNPHLCSGGSELPSWWPIRISVWVNEAKGSDMVPSSFLFYTTCSRQWPGQMYLLWRCQLAMDGLVLVGDWEALGQSNHLAILPKPRYPNIDFILYDFYLPLRIHILLSLFSAASWTASWINRLPCPLVEGLEWGVWRTIKRKESEGGVFVSLGLSALTVFGWPLSLLQSARQPLLSLIPQAKMW